MINMLESRPSPLLQPYIKDFSLREFDTSGQEIKKPLHAIHEVYMSFYLNEKLPVLTNVDNIVDEKFIYGLHTFSRGMACYHKEHFRVFCIVFRPNGFYRLFGVPASEFTDTVLRCNDLFAGSINRLLMQLQEARNYNEMVAYAEQFLLLHLSQSKAKDPHHSIQTASRLLLQYTGNVSIEWLAYESNMSIKTFERAFTAQVGTSPKLFARIARFNAALNLKLLQRERDWTSIAHQCGYFDQMHFIKDFKAFAGETPARFFKSSPPPVEDIQNSPGMTEEEF